MPRTLNQYATTSEFIPRFFDNSYNFEGRFVTNPGAAELTFRAIGLPVKLNGDDWEICAAGDESSAIAFLTEVRSDSIPVGGKTQRKFLALVRGPACVDLNGFPETDPAGAAYDVPALQAAFAAMVPFVRVTDSSANKGVGHLTA